MGERKSQIVAKSVYKSSSVAKEPLDSGCSVDAQTLEQF
jgi:hypothetical protein